MANSKAKVLLAFFLLMLLSITIQVMMKQFIWKESSSTFTFRPNFSKTESDSSKFLNNSNVSISTIPNDNTDSIALFIRMGGKVTELKRRFYCIFLRSSVLFWPASLGKTVIVLDKESDQDHKFAETLTRQTKEHFPYHTFEVLYEPLPIDPRVLDFPGSPSPPGYNRQLWSSFFIDLYTNDSVIAWMDTDAPFGSPVTKSSIFNGTKLRVLGCDFTMRFVWVQGWAKSTELTLGLPFVADFMTYFPVYIYRDTFTHCREYLLKRFKTRSFEEAFRKFFIGLVSPVNVILNYAWYFERDRYDWNLKIDNNLMQYNKRFPAGHTIGQEHIEDTLSVPQTAFHISSPPRILNKIGPYIKNSYCLSHEAAGNVLEKCSNHSASLSGNLVLFNHDIHRFDFPAPPCPGERRNTCLQILERYYNEVGLEIKQKARKLDWNNVKTVEKLAEESNLKCSSFE